ncbi:hypothetical protein SCUCBS95973_002387 [Sporothrix curviconia]|uniref:Major facilitator superfamily (MFS) profile domain-containing protein n=1 Tax=Sporothrix curviconia TaxID=1260050 RepID=A0ABP0B6G6_9PEZI
MPLQHDSFRLMADEDMEKEYRPQLHQSTPSPSPSPPPPPPSKPGPVTWSSLPRKGQLVILFLCRFVDFLQVASLQAYVFYQLKSMNGDNTSDAAVSTQAGLLQACFTGAQVLTAILWGKAADASWCGRKRVLLIGLAGTAVSCVGYGFATTFFWAAVWRVVGGGINGTVGIIRTMISEIIKDKKYQSRAFLILPMSFNLANMIGPVMGGFLADAPTSLPALFGLDGLWGFQWIQDYPYALPSVLNAVALAVTALVVFFCLEETSKERVGRFDAGLYAASRIRQIITRTPSTEGYAPIQASEPATIPMESVSRPVSSSSSTMPPRIRQKLPFSRLWTRNVVLTLVTIALYDFHLGAFANVWALFLSTPRTENGAASAHGLGMPASRVGVATSFLGVLGMLLQLTLYPPISARLGTLRSFRWFLVGFPLAYFAAPLLAVLPSSTMPPLPAAGFFVWAGILIVLFLQVTARTFTLPASIILLNNCSPHPSVLGTVHGLGQSVSAGFRTVGPVVGGIWYGWGLQHGAVAAGWWAVAALSVVGCVSALWIYEGSGHEIVLDGDMDEEK